MDDSFKATDGEYDDQVDGENPTIKNKKLADEEAIDESSPFGTAPEGPADVDEMQAVFGGNTNEVQELSSVEAKVMGDQSEEE